jgi:hypothetical protein
MEDDSDWFSLPYELPEVELSACYPPPRSSLEELPYDTVLWAKVNRVGKVTGAMIFSRAGDGRWLLVFPPGFLEKQT